MMACGIQCSQPRCGSKARYLALCRESLVPGIVLVQMTVQQGLQPCNPGQACLLLTESEARVYIHPAASGGQIQKSVQSPAVTRSW